MKYTPEEYNKLVKSVEDELTALLAKSESEISQPLVKAEDEKKEDSEDKKEDSKVEAKDEDKKEEETANKEDECDYDDEDKEEMNKMYTSMSKGELKAHKESVEKCWMAKCGDMQQMAKSEETSVEAKAKTEESKEEVTLVKSENETLKKENEDLKKNMESLIVSMNKFLSTKAPERKAVTDISFIAKSEEVKPETKPLSKSDINGILSKKTQDASLSKSDRELINNYYLNNAAIDTVSHLLK